MTFFVPLSNFLPFLSLASFHDMGPGMFINGQQQKIALGIIYNCMERWNGKQNLVNNVHLQ